MYKQISGVCPQTCRENVTRTTEAYSEFLRTLQSVKLIDYEQKKANDKERSRLLKEKRMAESFKRQSSKLKPIWPTLHEKRFFECKSAVSIDKGCVYLSGKEKERLMQPVKCHDFSSRFRGTRTSEKG